MGRIFRDRTNPLDTLNDDVTLYSHYFVDAITTKNNGALFPLVVQINSGSTVDVHTIISLTLTFHCP